MNPILRTRRNTATYAFVMLIFSVIYALLFAIGTGVDVATVAADAIVFGVVYGLEGVVLWNILRYALPDQTTKTEILGIAATVVIMAAIAIGAEALTAYATSPDSFSLFAYTIPQRALVVLLALSILVMLHLQHITNLIHENEKLSVIPIKTSTNRNNTINRITLKIGHKIKFISIAEIEYIKAEGDYVAVVTTEGRWLKEWTMKYLEENLPQDMFIRIHRSYIVSMSNITRIERVGKLYQVVLRSGEEVRVSPTGYKILKEKIKL